MGNKRNRQRKRKRNRAPKANKLKQSIRKQPLIDNNHRTSEDANNQTSLKRFKSMDNDLKSPGASDLACDISPVGSLQHESKFSSTKDSKIQIQPQISVSEVQYEIGRNPNWCLKTYSSVKKASLSSLQPKFSPTKDSIIPTQPQISVSGVQYEIGRNPNWCLKTYSTVKNARLSSRQLGEKRAKS